MTILHLDSSAIVKLVVAEIGSDDLRRVIAGATLVTSRIAVVEVVRAVARVDPTADPRPWLELFSYVELDESLAWEAGATGEAALRALDAIHVASARLLGDELDGFVTYDVRQAVAAGAAGLRVLSPGVDVLPG